MLISDLKTLTALESEITKLQLAMVDLFKQRSRILDTADATVAGTRVAPRNIAAEAEGILQAGIDAWAYYGIRVAGRIRLQSQLSEAVRLRNELADTYDDESHIHILLIPPDKQLRRALTHKNAPLMKTPPLDEYLTGKHSHWQVGLFFDGKYRIEIKSFQDYLLGEPVTVQGHVVAKLGVNTFTAAYLQGLILADGNDWTSLLADYHAKNIVAPCARVEDEKLVIDCDDSAGILGTNYVYPMIEIASYA